MRLQFYMGHPAHFHLFKNVIENLQQNGHEIALLIKKKEILEELLQRAGISYNNILKEGRKDSKLGILIGMLKKAYRSGKFAKKFKPDLLIGTSVENSLLTKILGIPSVFVGEDDAHVIPLHAKISYPWATEIITPDVCDNGKWNLKSTKYSSYQELAYLHPNHFVPDKTLVEKYFSPNETYFILRFVKLKAHHDSGIEGINKKLAKRLINTLIQYGKVYITSERELEPEFEPYKISIDPLDIHHVLAFAKLCIGDSQTMAAEAGVLGTPFIRFNDFIGRIGYLNDLENKYHLGFGFKPNQAEELLQKVEELLNSNNSNSVFKKRRERMLSDKIDFAAFMVWFIENYPSSAEIMRENPNYQFNFK